MVTMNSTLNDIDDRRHVVISFKLNRFFSRVRPKRGPTVKSILHPIFTSKSIAMKFRLYYKAYIFVEIFGFFPSYIFIDVEE